MTRCVLAEREKASTTLLCSTGLREDGLEATAGPVRGKRSDRLPDAPAEAIEEENRDTALRLEAEGSLRTFKHMKGAHAPRQRQTPARVHAHRGMLRLSCRYGNTGGATFGAFDKMPVPPGLRRPAVTADPRE